MTDDGFRRFGALCAGGVGVASLALALAIVAAGGWPAPGLGGVLLGRLSSPIANGLLAAVGLFMSVAVVALLDRLPDRGGAWGRWAGALGLIGAAMTAAHGVWDVLRLPALLAQWQTGDAARQAAIAAFSGVPNPVDPRGLGSFLFVGLFVLVVGRLGLARGGLTRPVAQLAVVFGSLLGLLFAVGLTGPDIARAGLAALTMGAVGPIWWLMVARELAAG